MHPNARFHADAAAGLALVEEIAFATLASDGIVAHAPLTVVDGELWFHLARGNRLCAALPGRVTACVLDAGGYVTPDWYARGANQVPTWNYRAAEAEGMVRALDDADVLRQMDMLADAHEPRVGGRWTRAKLDDAAQAALIGAIRGFALTPDAWRVTLKASQNKAAADRDGVRAGLARAGREDMLRWTA
jgi:transcriptional regulator